MRAEKRHYVRPMGRGSFPTRGYSMAVEGEAGQTTGAQGPGLGSGLKDVVAVSVACVALTGFGVLVLALLFQLDLPEVGWGRAAFLLNGVEAIAFAAAGYLF